MQRSVQLWWLGGLLFLAGCSDEVTPGLGGGAGTSGGVTASAGQAAGGSPAGAGANGVVAGGAGGSMTMGGAGSGSMAGSGPAAGATAGAGGQGGGRPMNEVFKECRLHFGTIDTKAKENPALIPHLDFFTPGWMGLSDTFDQSYVCEEAKPGAVLGNQVPVIVAYVSAFYVKRHHGMLCDCNVPDCGETDGKANDLCHFGAQYIKQDLAAIIGVYENYAQGYASCYGTTRPIVFEMEPDWYQYIGSTQTSPLSKQEAGDILEQYVGAIRKHLPNAHFSIDISPWVDDNGGSNGRDWYSNFDLSLFTFANTSGGSTLGSNSKIRAENNMTWRGVSEVTGKPVLADTGYGANGVSAGHDANWDMADNLNARIDDGVISISQYNPDPNWATTIAAVRSQLKTPKVCP